MIKNTFLRLIPILVLFNVAFASTAKAQLFLEEGKVVLAVDGGERVNKSVTVSNTSSESVNVKIYWEDFQYEPPYEGSKSFVPAGTGTASASKWVSFSPQEITLPAFAKQKIDYTISVPATMDKGYYGVLFFEKQGSTLKDASGINIITRVGCLFFIEPKNADRKALVDGLAVSPKGLTGQFTNQSNVILIPRIVYNLMDEGGMVKDRGELKKLYVPPSKSASWQMSFPTDLAQGRYSLVINIDLGEEESLVKEMEIVKDASGQLTIEHLRD